MSEKKTEKQDDRNSSSRELPPDISVLLDERKLIKDRIARTDRMMFQFITVVLSPFCILIGYSLLNFEPKFQFVLLVVPFFTILAVMIMGILYMHHYVAGYYCRYLVKEINKHLSNHPLLLEKLDYDFFATGFGLQNILILVVYFIVIVLNLSIMLLFPDIIRNLPELKLIRQDQVGFVSFAYWSSLLFVCVLGITSCVIQFKIKVRKLREMTESDKSANCQK